MMAKRAIAAQDIADVLDHSLLRPDITVEELKYGCLLAKEYRCVSVCVRPSDLPIVTRELQGTDVLCTTVIAFPHGTATTHAKLFEIQDAVSYGAVEVDMVLNYARLLSGDAAYVEDEIASAARAAHDGGALIKVIFENYYLSDLQKIQCCRMCKRADVDFIKTSTGYAPGGATVADLKLMAAHAQGMRVKAAGGVKTLDEALAMMAAGAARIGTRASKEILQQARARGDSLFIE